MLNDITCADLGEVLDGLVKRIYWPKLRVRTAPLPIAGWRWLN